MVHTIPASVALALIIQLKIQVCCTTEDQENRDVTDQSKDLTSEFF
jgi:hypothetical protein